MKRIDPYKPLSLALTALALVGAAFVAVHLLYSSYCSLTWFKYTLTDYGKYTNWMWNSGHLDWFRYLYDRSYLITHLSYTLAPLGLLFHVWDHPMLLALVQWSLILGGTAFLWRAGRRTRVQGDVIAACLFFFLGYRLTQAVQLSEFHGVCGYLIGIPWLYYTLRLNKRWTWIPLVFVLGVREDAFILILPMLLYFAVKDRWWPGYVYLAAALAYGAFAIFWLYPAINGIDLLVRRQGFIDHDALIPHFDHAWWQARHLTIYWTLIPALLFMHRRGWAVLIFPFSALMTALLSGFATQQTLGTHYGAGVIATLGPALIESASLRLPDRTSRPRRTAIAWTLRAAALMILTVVVHVQSGFIWGGGKNFEIYRHPSFEGQLALRAARHVPKQGVLMTEDRLCGFVANRADLLPEELYEERIPIDVVFTTLSSMRRPPASQYIDWMKDGAMGATYFDGYFLVLERGADTSLNAEVLEAFDNSLICIAVTPSHGGTEINDADGRPVRYWEGDGSRGPINLSFGGHNTLKPGHYTAILTYRAATPKRKVRDSWGWFSVHRFNERDPIKECQLPAKASPGNDYITCSLPLDITARTPVEIRVTGADAELWLRSVIFKPEP